MNILFLSELFYPRGGGAEFATYLYAKFLAKSGFTVTVVTNKFVSEKDFELRDDISIYRLPLFGKKTGLKYSLLRKSNVLSSGLMSHLYKQASLIYVPRLWYAAVPWSRLHRKPVLVHVHDYTPICPLALLQGSAEELLCENVVCSAKCIYMFEREKGSTLRDSILSTFLNFSMRQVLKEFVREANAIVCVSKSQHKILSERMPSARHKLHLVYNPLPDLSPTELKGDDYAYFGGKNIFKGFKVLLDALTRGKSNNIIVHMVGMRHIDSAHSISLESNKIIMHKWLSHSQQGHLYEQIKAVLFPSIVAEPLPYITAEALMRARVLIASRVGGIPEQVAGCKGVFLFEPGNYRELHEAIEHVESLTKEQLVDLAHQNRKTFTRNFSNELSIKAFIRIIDKLV